MTLLSGLVLFGFATTHFLNHALGLISIEAMHDAQQWRLAVTRSLAGTIVLAAALLTHVVMALVKMAGRATLRLPGWELAQIATGLAIPFLLFPHIVNTRIAHTIAGVNDSYLYELAQLWPGSAIPQGALLLVVWSHGCLGIHHWLRHKPSYAAAKPGLALIAIALPTAALAGFMVSGRAVAALMLDPDMAVRIRELTNWPSTATEDLLAWLRLAARVGFLIILCAVVIWMFFRKAAAVAAPKLTIRYAGGPTVSSAGGATLLETSRMNRIAHAAECGGRARCGMCQVRIDDGAEWLDPPRLAEAFRLAALGAPPTVRLACQIRPHRDLTVTRLVRPAAAEQAASTDDDEGAGIETKLALLLVGMAEFDEITRDRIAYDVIFLLNEFFAAAGAAITLNDGWIDGFHGHQLLAVFGQKAGVEAGVGQAIRAAGAIDSALDRLNEKVAAEIGRRVRCAMSIHAGPLLLGRIGYGSTKSLSVLGRTVEVVRLLDGGASAHEAQLTISADAARLGGITLAIPSALVSCGKGEDGATQTIEVYRTANARDFSPVVAAVTPQSIQT
ncbi:MAG: adenylate/guanylate cyclase domain-containing protein [Devosia sp.]